MNNTRVRSCRLRGSRMTGGAVEVFLLRRKNGLCFEAMFRPGRLKIGERVRFEHSNITAVRTGPDEATFEAASADEIYSIGEVPLPPYIKRRPQPLDAEYYQTVYAQYNGSVASPTAGLHFTRQLLRKIRARGVRTAYITLHVGAATFRPVAVDDIRNHVMSEEYFSVPERTRALLAASSAKCSGRVIAAGTTTCRALETYGRGCAKGYTRLFIYPGHKFSVVDGLLTNFHLPQTTLFMLVCAFAGTALMHRAYEQAISKKYRFYSYGDAMLIL